MKLKNHTSLYSYLVCLSLISITACSHIGGGHHSAKVTTGQLADLKYYFRSKTYFTGQPTAAGLHKAKAEGVTAVINLRTDEEMKSVNLDEAKTVKDLGLHYYQIPVPGDQEYSAATFAKVEQIFMSHHKKGEKVLIHCGSGGRAASWFAYHLKMTHGDSIDSALEQTDDIGLKSHPGIREKTRRLLRE